MIHIGVSWQIDIIYIVGVSVNHYCIWVALKTIVGKKCIYKDVALTVNVKRCDAG